MIRTTMSTEADIRGFVMRFPKAVLDGDRIVAQGRVTGMREVNGERLADGAIWLHREGTGHPLEGTATVAIPA